MSVTELTKPRPSIRAKMWRVLHDRKWWTCHYLALEMDVTRENVDRRYLRYLTKAGYLERRGSRPEEWRLIRGGVDAPRFSAAGEEIKTSGANEAIWRTMRILKRFSCREIAAQVAQYATGETVGSYVQALHRAGYLTATGACKRLIRYRLIRDTGPKPPQILRIKEVYDPNLDAIMSREVPGYDG